MTDGEDGGALAAPGTLENVVARSPAIVPETFEDIDGTLTRVHRDYEKVVRIRGAGFALVGAIATVAGDAALPFVPGAIAVPVLVLLAVLLWQMPHRRFIARGYSFDQDRLRVVRGLLFRSDTVVPFGRVQHIDVDRGPLERYFDLATITLHTAGTHNASVSLPGLAHDTALTMREEIRARIRREAQ
ncbi:PH domain-containing protein [Parerythrobacter aurantius]|uniref:PH domain-containing protein n=1 Tax=Parerythrobacter aurantius TaxID=3127706 RepID=UPI003247CE4B